MKHFEAAIDTGTPNADRLVKAARAAFQLNQIGVPVNPQLGWAGVLRPLLAPAGGVAADIRERTQPLAVDDPSMNSRAQSHA
jgi:hypothetical protein